MFIIFCVLQAVVQAFVWGVLIWLWATSGHLPELSAYPLIDFATKIHLVDEADGTTLSKGVNNVLDDAISDRLLRKALRHRRVMTTSAAKLETREEPSSVGEQVQSREVTPQVIVTRSRTA